MARRTGVSRERLERFGDVGLGYLKVFDQFGVRINTGARRRGMIGPKKSSRHAKIAGDFGENLVLYWLSKNGFECARIDHTGIDLIARNQHTHEIMGISVKSRTRYAGTEKESVSILNHDLAMAEETCKVFAWVPYFAIVVDAGDRIRAFLLPMKHLRNLFPRGKTGFYWKMSEKNLAQYLDDPEIKTFVFTTETRRWWKSPEGP